MIFVSKKSPYDVNFGSFWTCKASDTMWFCYHMVRVKKLDFLALSAYFAIILALICAYFALILALILGGGSSAYSPPGYKVI